jgi:hypothetical protein
VEEATHGFDRASRFAVNPLQRLVDGVRIGEDVVGGLPIGVLVGGAKARYPERCRISECSTNIGGRGPVPCCGDECIYDFDRIVAEKPIGQRDVVRPVSCCRLSR